MTTRVVYHPAAIRELRAAVAWSDEFFESGAELDAVVLDLEALVARMPYASPVAHDAPLRREDVRQARVGRFPYRLVFLVQARDIVVLAVAHLRRRPGYWRRRLK